MEAQERQKEIAVLESKHDYIENAQNFKREINEIATHHKQKKEKAKKTLHFKVSSKREKNRRQLRESQAVHTRNKSSRALRARQEKQMLQRFLDEDKELEKEKRRRIKLEVSGVFSRTIELIYRLNQKGNVKSRKNWRGKLWRQKRGMKMLSRGGKLKLEDKKNSMKN